MPKCQDWYSRRSEYIYFFAVTTSLLWVWVIAQGLRRFPKPPVPNDYSASHKFWAWLAAIDMGFTALTGWIFYVLAFVA